MCVCVCVYVCVCVCVLTGKAQEAYSALSATNSLCYNSVKAAVLKANEMVPEAYRKRFQKG